MQIYLVGGAVRDLLLGIPSTDYDYVVVGADIQTMLDLGYILVGKDFPVFLHPKTHQEYALARTERKIAKGYNGFSIYADKSISLKQDLQRRDLTINAMALPVNEHHQPLGLEYLIDYFYGKQDLEHGILKHVSKAFSEDPVRILRIARFAARYNFTVHTDTYQLMQEMVNQHEIQALVSERIWQELIKGFNEAYPQNLLYVLNKCGTLEYILPPLCTNLSQHIKFLSNIKTYNIYQYEEYNKNYPLKLDIQYILPALLISSSLEQVILLNKSLKIPKTIQDLCIITHKLYYKLIFIIQHKVDLTAELILEILHINDVIRRPDRFNKIVHIILLYQYGYNAQIINKSLFIILYKAMQVCKNLDIKNILNNKPENITIQQAINYARIIEINKVIKNYDINL